jgi:hypothetical protein
MAHGQFDPGKIMGEETMFDLNEQITKWRDSLKESQSLESKDIDELESHLREEIDNLSGSKLSVEEIFRIATHRLGNTDNLAYEYAKVNRGKQDRQNISWIITGMLIYIFAMYFTQLAAQGSVRIAINKGIADYVSLGWIALVGQLSLFLLTLIFSYLLYRLLIKIPTWEKINIQLSSRSTLLTSFLVFLGITTIYRIGLHIPLPAFRYMDNQTLIESSLKYSQSIWSLLLPIVLVLLLIGLRKPSEKIKT